MLFLHPRLDSIDSRSFKLILDNNTRQPGQRETALTVGHHKRHKRHKLQAPQAATDTTGTTGTISTTRDHRV
jgi:hypothetical protein